MHKYLFFLGHQPHISAAEIAAGFSSSKIKYDVAKEKNNLMVISADKPIEPEEMIMRLGGTVKIAETIDQSGNNQQDIINHLKLTQSEGKIQFALSGPDNKKISLGVKKELKKQGRNVRYVEIKNTATILHNNLIEKNGDFTIFGGDIFVTRAIQPIEDFSQRDFGRPESDSKSGMIPPKLAKIMINLAKIKNDSAILDPFCGSGTILMEAAVAGFKNLIGSDVSSKAVQDTIKNIEWTENRFKIKDLRLKIFDCDIAKLDEKIKANSIDAIITEPYLGRPLRGNEEKYFLQKQADELSNLYVQAFEIFCQTLKMDGVIIFIIPSFRHKNEWVEINCVEKIKKIGFEPIPFEKTLSLQYWRQGQKLARNIWRFKKKL